MDFGIEEEKRKALVQAGREGAENILAGMTMLKIRQLTIQGI